MYKILSGINSGYNEDIQFLYDILDKNLPTILENIAIEIKDFSSANKAKEKYSKDWFKFQLLSVDAKIKIATLLKNLCKDYGVESTTWNLIQQASTATIEQIDILQNKDDLKKSWGD